MSSYCLILSDGVEPKVDDTEITSKKRHQEQDSRMVKKPRVEVPVVIKLHKSLADEDRRSSFRIELMDINQLWKLKEFDRRKVEEMRYDSKDQTSQHVQSIAALLDKYGQVDPCIVDCWPGHKSYVRWQGIMIEGCHRILAAKGLGWTHLAVKFEPRTQHHVVAQNLGRSFDDRSHPRPYPKASTFGFEITAFAPWMVIEEPLPSVDEMKEQDGWRP